MERTFRFDRKPPSVVSQGYTLLELVVVTSLIAILAAVALPGFRASDDERVQLAAVTAAEAMRFARAESIRTGEPHGFRFLTNQYRIRVFSADTTGTPWTWVWDVYHPIDKQLYDYTFPAELTPVTQTPVYRGTCDRDGVIYFDAHGTPRCLEPESILLDSYELNIGAGQATVRLDGITGRVTLETL